MQIINETIDIPTEAGINIQNITSPFKKRPPRRTDERSFSYEIRLINNRSCFDSFKAGSFGVGEN